ncbi:MAG: hypothetical protein RR233_08340, partial [Clostridiales bacterium]
MELFKILGTIAVDNANANKALDETAGKADKAGNTMSAGLKKSGASVGKSLNEIAKESGKTVNELKSDVMKAASEYHKSGMSMSDAMKKAYSDIGYQSQSTTKKVQADGENTSNSLVSSFKRIGAAVGTYLAVDKIIGFGKSCVEAAATVKAQNSQFEAAFGDLQRKANKSFEKIGEDTGVLTSRLKLVGTQGFSQFKGAGLDAVESLKKTNEFTRLAADGAAYYDMSLEETSELMRSFIRGNTEAGDRIGLFTSETQRNDLALEKLGKKYVDCTEAEKQMIMLDIANSIYKSSGAMGQASRE